MKSVHVRCHLLAVTTFVAWPCLAQPYVGVAGGVSVYRQNLISEIQSQYSTTAWPTARGSVTDNDAGTWSVFGGYRFNPYFDAELGYYDFGRMDSRYSVVETAYQATLRHDVTGIGLSALGRWEFAPGFSVYGRLGVMWTRTAYREQGTAYFDFSDQRTIDISTTTHSTVPIFGLGLGYAFNPNVEARVDWQRADGLGDSWRLDREQTGNIDIDSFTVQLLYRF